jgi:hypothetical protein
MKVSIKEFILVALVSLILFPTYATMSYAEIPVSAQTCVATDANVFIDSSLEVTNANFACNTITTTLQTKVNFAIFSITLMTIVGWAMLMFFLPIGMWAYPF